MISQELRDKFLKFFESKGHKIIPSSPLLPEDDPTVLFTTAGMQQFKPYFAGVKDVVKEYGNKNLASVQKCFRTSDIESVGDESHLTFFEMLGNFSIGGYGKKEAIKFAWELMTSKDWYGLPNDKFFATVFAGDNEIPADTESEKFWKEVAPGIEVKRSGREENFWPNPIWIGTCGPSLELHYVLDDGSNIEVWNLVFTQYFHNEDGTFKDLGQVNIDTGMGLERLAMIAQKKKTIFETDLFNAAKEVLEEVDTIKSPESVSAIRIVLDHIKAAIFIIDDGIEPSNKEQGYVLRRLIRSSALHAKIANIDLLKEGPFGLIVNEFTRIYGNFYPTILHNKGKINTILDNELVKFYKTLDIGMKKILSRQSSGPISGSEAFNFYQTYGFPPELMKKFAEVNLEGFEEAMQHHQELSRTASSGMFKGGLADHSDVVIKYHTATHLLHQALRDVLGAEVFQKGSNITAERLRFDFSFNRKMTDEEIKKVEYIINQKIKEDLKVDHMIITLDEAKKMNAIGLFDEKYVDKVSIYGVGPGYKLDGGYYSLEFCGGPHVERTSVIGKIKITQEEAVSAGTRRIRAEIVLR